MGFFIQMIKIMKDINQFVNNWKIIQKQIWTWIWIWTSDMVISIDKAIRIINNHNYLIINNNDMEILVIININKNKIDILTNTKYHTNIHMDIHQIFSNPTTYLNIQYPHKCLIESLIINNSHFTNIRIDIKIQINNQIEILILILTAL